MSEKTCTVVTMFFNLAALEDASPETRPPEFYMKHGRNTLSLPFPMAVFCDAHTYPLLKQIRDTYSSAYQQTEYFIKHISEYDFYRENYPVIQENRRTHPTADQRNTPSYYLLNMFKANCLYYAKLKNPFQTTHYAWVDMGCSHVVRDFSVFVPRMLRDPHPRVAVCFIHYRSPEELYPYSRYLANGGPCGIAGTTFTVEADYVFRFKTLMQQMFYEMTYAGYGHSDETVMVYAYHRDPALFTPYFGDYYSVFANYHQPRQDHDSIVHFFIEEARTKGNSVLARQAAQQLLSYIDLIGGSNGTVSPYREYLHNILLETKGES